MAHKDLARSEEKSDGRLVFWHVLLTLLSVRCTQHTHTLRHTTCRHNSSSIHDSECNGRLFQIFSAVETFCGGEGLERKADESIWDLVVSFNMYDPMALLCAVRSFSFPCPWFARFFRSAYA